MSTRIDQVDGFDMADVDLRQGWRTILSLFLCTLLLFGVSIYSFIVLAHPLGNEYGWSGAEVGGAVSAMWLTAPIALLSGSALKRWQPWHIIYAGLLTQAVAFLLLPQIENIQMLYLLRLMMGVGKVAVITAVPIVLTNFFSRKFASAMAIVWAGGAAGGFLLSPITNILLEGFGWRWAASAIGFGIIVGIGLIALLANSDARAVSSSLSQVANTTPPQPDLSVKESEQAAGRKGLRAMLSGIPTSTAIAMFIAVIGIGMASIAVLTQEQAVLETSGFSSNKAATYLGLTAIGSLIGSATIGWLLDRKIAFWSGLLTAISVYAGLLAFIFIGQDGNAGLAFFASISCGYAFGAGEVLWITLTKRQFGTQVFATTYGGWYFALQIGYAAGGAIAGWAFSEFGAFGFLGLVAIMYMPAALLSLILRGARLSPAQL